MRSSVSPTRRRILAAAAVAVSASAGVLVPAAPAAANTNFNAVCESEEACLYSIRSYLTNQGLWDFEGTDTDFRNNWYPNGYGQNIDNTGSSFRNYGVSCTAVFADGYGGPANASKAIVLGLGMQVSLEGGHPWDYTASQLYWIC